MRKWLSLLYRILYWAIPVIILYMIFKRIDFSAFKLNIAKTNPWLVALGMALYPFIMILGALRWHVLLTQYNKRKPKLGFVLKHYWIGSAIGRFTPASLGWEAYRVAVSGRYFGHYSVNVAVVGAEKLLALLVCMSLIIILYPVIPIHASLELNTILRIAYILFSVAVILFLLINFSLRNRVVSMFLSKLELFFSALLKRIANKVGLSEQVPTNGLPIRAMIEPLTVPRQVIPNIVLTFGIQLVSATCVHIYFWALGYDLPFIANLFVTPILYFIFFLPVSFGSLGIREGAFILLYGLFGVPPETALLISFFALSGTLLNNLIGGLLMLLSNVKGKTLPKIDIED